MRDLRDVVAAYDALCEQAEAGVLASVVRTRGSTYRRPGARMLVRPDGSSVGLVGGGCLEGDLAERARQVRSVGVPALVRYDAEREDEIVWGFGLGCGGVVEVLLERVERGSPGPLGWLRDWMEKGEPGAIATRLGGADLGWRAARHSDGRVACSSGRVPRAVARALVTATRSERSGIMGDYLVEFVPAPIRLAVFGAGADAEPLVNAALALGWTVVVSDHRPAYAKPERFVGAQVVLADSESAARAVEVDARTHAVVMTHNFLLDASLLRGLLESRAAHVAVLGPKRRTEDLLAQLRSEGFEPSDAALSTIFAPAGLDLGAEAPAEIALSIVSEIQAVSQSRGGGFLRDRRGPIHDPFER